MADIVNSIAIGGAGGAIAGVTVWLVQYIHTKTVERADKSRVYEWLDKKTGGETGYTYRSTRTIASSNNLTQDRVRFICCIHPNIRFTTVGKDDLWEIRKNGEGSDDAEPSDVTTATNEPERPE